ncbi:cell wall protein [Diplodia corticola]|uniref:Cell wall protein n=1 Tax=Diplodia corticola TaxID=236234 RepID=A0A1J9RMU3_9PEZI|nr:cell wall protein [Diplodia corticola]OJD33891.1 cell wall protein [Diplodia corticola]
MKTTAVLASTLACAASTLAAPTTTTYYNLVASASGAAFDGQSLKANGGFWYIGKETSSTCGDVAPAVTVGSAGSLAFHGDGKQNQQRGFVDISGAASGLFGYTLPDKAVSAEQTADKFSLTGSEMDSIKLFFDGASSWLACPTDVAGQYMVYPEKSYAKSVGKDKCTKFEIGATQVETPKEVCIYN